MVNNKRTKGNSDIQFTKFQKTEHFLSSLYEFRYNIISNEIEQRDKNSTSAKWIIVNIDNLYRTLENKRINIKPQDIKSILRTDYVSLHNPFESYFEKLPSWDQKTDYIEELCTFFSAENNDLFRKHFKKMLVRVIKCALVDSYFNKQCFVLIGKQNDGKTYFCNWLCPEELKAYFTDNFTDDKDGLIALSSNIFINLDELAVKTKVELTRLKSIFSKSTVSVRRPYDAKVTNTPRRCSFLGSTNEAEFLSDTTGSVRWLCFKIDKINKDYSTKIDVNNIWSQAYHLYKSNYKCDLTEAEIEENDLANREFFINTPEIEYVSRYFEPATKENHQLFLTTTEIQKEIDFYKSDNTKITTHNIGKALRFLRFKPESKRIKETDHPIKGYYVNKKP